MKDIEFLKSHNVDVEKSLELFGDIETYNDTIKEFQTSIDTKLSEIKKYFNDQDMPNYAIYVHSLKSDCKYFDFTTLAELSYQHEMESKANNYNFVKDNIETLLAEAEKVKAILNEYVGSETTTAVSESNSVEATSSTDEDIILIAEDNEVVRVFVKKIFEDKYNIMMAEDGEKALEIIQANETNDKISAILLDLNMPKKDGFAVLDYLKEKNLLKKMPVTVVSGESSADAINRAFTYDIVDMLNKPFSEIKIKDAVEKTISSKKKN